MDGTNDTTSSRRTLLKLLAGGLSLGGAGYALSRLGPPGDRPTPADGPDRRSTPTDGPDRESPEPTRTDTPEPATPARRGIGFDTTVDVVDDLGVDPTGSEPVTGRLAEAMAPGTLLQFPPGTYQLAPRPVEVPGPNVGFVATEPDAETVWRLAPDYHGPFLRCEADNLLFGGIDVDMSARPHQSGHMRIQAPSRFHVENVTYRGRGQGPGFAFQVAITDAPDGVGTLRGVRVPHGSRPDRYAPPGGGKGNGRIGVFAGLTHRGVLEIADCEFGEFGNNAVYASRTPGDVRVSDSYFLNNAPNSIRLSGAGSWAKRCVVELDFGKYEGPPTETRWGTWGISCENAREGSTTAEYPPEEPGMLVADCEVLLKRVDARGRVGAGIRLASKARSMVVRDTRVHVETERGFGRSPHAVLRVNPFLDHRNYRADRQDPPAPHAIELDGLRVTGRVADSAAVRIAHASGSVLRNCHISQRGRGRDGVRLIQSPGCRIVGGRVETPHYPLVIDANSVEDCLVSFARNPTLTSTGDVEATELSNSPVTGSLDGACRSLYGDGDRPMTVRIAAIGPDALYGTATSNTV
jgi:hypothetical protein